MSRPEPLDIRALLREALDDKPSRDLSEGVLSRLAAVKTVVEMTRLVGVAPSKWSQTDSEADSEDSNPEEDDDE